MKHPSRSARHRAGSIAAALAGVVAMTLAPTTAMASPPTSEEVGGSVAHHRYFSENLGAESGVVVYTPPQYDARRPLPVLYIAPGGCRDEEHWFTIPGVDAESLDAVFHSGDAEPMIIVSVNGSVGSDLFESPLADPFPTELVDSVVPFVDAHYATIPNGRHRALAGNSCGGIQVLNTLIQYPGAFSEIGLWSTGWFPSTLESFATDPALAATLESPRLEHGTRYLEARVGADDFLAGPNLQATADFLATEAGIETPTFEAIPGIGHDDEAGRLALFGGLKSFFD
ncbi:hypothetical protein GCM10025877_16800 [Agromyces mangrovi Wang et al. 2018]|nr:hypothetical protein GCM10025877_16800 [Agromyces mangrovi]